MCGTENFFCVSANGTLSSQGLLQAGGGGCTGAVRLASSTEAFAEFDDDESLAVLQSEHCPQHPNMTFPSPPECILLVVSQEEVLQAAHSFQKGSAGGSDGLHPQHLLDLISKSTGTGGQSLLQSITTQQASFGQAMFHLIDFRPIFFGAFLTALKKKEGGIHPMHIFNAWYQVR